MVTTVLPYYDIFVATVSNEHEKTITNFSLVLVEKKTSVFSFFLKDDKVLMKVSTEATNSVLNE